LFAALNRGNRSITLDPEAFPKQEILSALLKRADVLVHNLPPARAECLGLDRKSSDEFPELIVVSVSGYGLEGPYSEYRCYPINASAVGGISVGIGRRGDRPLTIPMELGQYQMGLVAAIGVLTAYLARQEVGGQYIDVAETAVWATEHTGQNILTFLYLGVSGIRAGNHSIGPYPNSFLRCKDGYVCISLTPLDQWLKFLEIMGNPEWTQLPRYRNRRAMTDEYPDEVDALVSEWLMQHTCEEIFSMTRAAGLPIVPALSVADLLKHEHLEARGMLQPLSLRDNTYRVPRLPFVSSDAEGLTVAGVAPKVGEHTAEILGELGLTASELRELFECEAI
jgi:crotonobetainyl-CoA:carnitine CoA-transferase CaiB-like acyl-CoA transferase